MKLLSSADSYLQNEYSWIFPYALTASCSSFFYSRFQCNIKTWCANPDEPTLRTFKWGYVSHLLRQVSRIMDRIWKLKINKNNAHSSDRYINTSGSHIHFTYMLSELLLFNSFHSEFYLATIPSFVCNHAILNQISLLKHHTVWINKANTTEVLLKWRC